jgi:hypothetical protein
VSEPVGSIIDDVLEATRWKPLMPMLRRARQATDTAEKLIASRDAAAFILRQLTNADPYLSPAFVTFALVVELSQTDPRVRSTVERLLKLKGERNERHDPNAP